MIHKRMPLICWIHSLGLVLTAPGDSGLERQALPRLTLSNYASSSAKRHVPHFPPNVCHLTALYCLLLTSSSSIEAYLRNERLPGKLALIDAICQAALESGEMEVIQYWCSLQRGHTLASYVSADITNIPLLVSVACEYGIQAICQV